MKYLPAVSATREWIQPSGQLLPGSFLEKSFLGTGKSDSTYFLSPAGCGKEGGLMEDGAPYRRSAYVSSWLHECSADESYRRAAVRRRLYNFNGQSGQKLSPMSSHRAIRCVTFLLNLVWADPSSFTQFKSQSICFKGKLYSIESVLESFDSCIRGISNT
jgi:hypothetical protein